MIGGGRYTLEGDAFFSEEKLLTFGFLKGSYPLLVKAFLRVTILVLRIFLREIWGELVVLVVF